MGNPESSIRSELSRMLSRSELTQPRHGFYEIPSQKAAREQKGSSSPDTVHVPLVSLTASAGDGTAVLSEEVSAYLAYQQQSLRRETGTDPSRIRIIIGGGSSMMPTVMPGDRLMVEVLDSPQLEDSKIYIWRTIWGDTAVKRAHLKGPRVII